MQSQARFDAALPDDGGIVEIRAGGGPRTDHRAVVELAVLGVPEPQRDEFERSAMPDDTYALGPVAWIDLGQEVHDAGIEWGAWKAAVIISRRRQEQTDG